MLFADSNSKSGRSTPASLSFLHVLSLHSTLLAWQALVCDLWSTPVVKRSVSHRSVRTEYTPIDLTRTLFDFLSRALDCASALGRTRFTCSWPHAKSALFSRPLLLLQHFFMNMETESAVPTSCPFFSFQVTPILELIAVRVDRSYQNCNNHASQGDRKDSYVPARAA